MTRRAVQSATLKLFGWTRAARSAAVAVAVLLAAWGSPGGAAADPGNPDPLLHTVKAGDTLIKICSEYRTRTNHYSLNDLLNDLRRTNNLQGNLLQIGQKLEIPVLPVQPAPLVAARVAAGAEVRGIYLTGPACGVSSVWQRIDHFIEAGGNAVVFDAKDIDGGVSYRSGHPLAGWGKGRAAPVISSLPELMERCDRRGLYVIARVALFLDGELGRQRPDLALTDGEGRPWTERGCTWMDAANPEVRQYNLALARELAAAGVDEIQFDYVRFPTNGWREQWAVDDPGDLEQIAVRRRQVITSFLAEARNALHGLNVRVSADLYGIMAWGRLEDLALTGQHVPSIAQVVDVICPMIYPSHFGQGFEGRRRPGDDPEYFIGEGTRRFAEQAAGQAEIRPWLQAFPFLVTSYDGQYIETQIETSRKSGGAGWCLWNPACNYQTALEVLPGLCDDPALPAGAGLPLVAATPPPAPAVEVAQVALQPATPQPATPQPATPQPTTTPSASLPPEPALPARTARRDGPSTLLGALLAEPEIAAPPAGPGRAAPAQAGRRP